MDRAGRGMAKKVLKVLIRKDLLKETLVTMFVIDFNEDLTNNI